MAFTKKKDEQVEQQTAAGAIAAKANNLFSQMSNREDIQQEDKKNDFSKLKKSTYPVSCRIRLDKLQEIDEIAKEYKLDRADLFKIGVYRLLEDIQEGKVKASELLKYE